MTPESPARTMAAHQERLSLPWWAWPASLAAGAVLATELMLGTPELPIWLPYAVLIPLSLLILAPMGRIRIAVTADEFRVDDARIPVEFISGVVALDAAGKREVLGIGAHPLAFVVQKSSIGTAVQVLLDDPADPTPYWVVSTRRPVELATALLEVSRRARAERTSS
ncbi:MAG TPA: DUF3093 domain-containing protein [Actinoplanes sp.]|nr:DUF3093 domain-containing protein [Actinoplanes sp.]